MRRRYRRGADGATLTELLIASLLIAVSIAAIGEIMVLTTLTATRMSNRADGISGVRVAVNRIGSDVREANGFGDLYANENALPTDRYDFPATANPLYSAGTGPLFTSTSWAWTGWPVSWGTPPYTLSSTCLVLQKPVLFLDPLNDPASSSYNSGALQNKLNGFPIFVDAGSIGVGVPPRKIENRDTIIYRLVEDSAAPGEYQLQRARFVGPDQLTSSTYRTMISEPQVVMTGIIGPLPSGGGTVPEIFSYFRRGASGSFETLTDTELATSAMIDSIVGVGVDFEVMRPGTGSSGSEGSQPQRLGVHNESFLRWNKYARL